MHILGNQEFKEIYHTDQQVFEYSDMEINVNENWMGEML